jgi:acyl-CoA synthetase (AMP-forming)/AMP-acid ligase II
VYPSDPTAALTLVGSGRVRGGQTLAVVDPDSRRVLPDGRIGEIWIRGPSVAGGYFNRAAESVETFGACPLQDDGGPFLRTGDLGFLDGGEVYITGRAKEILIVRGSNYFPQDIESAASGCTVGLRSNGSAAFTVGDDRQERLIIVQEVERKALRSFDEEEAGIQIRAAVANEYGLQVSQVVFIPPNALPRTSSGKVQRLEARRRFEAGALPPLAVRSRATECVENDVALADQGETL